MVTEFIYLTNDNTIDLVLRSDRVVQDISLATRITLTFGSTVIDSDVVGLGEGQPFDNTQTVSATEAALHPEVSEGDPKLVLDLGQQSIPAGDYDAELVVYDTTHTHGINWGTIPIKVV